MAKTKEENVLTATVLAHITTLAKLLSQSASKRFLITLESVALLNTAKSEAGSLKAAQKIYKRARRKVLESRFTAYGIDTTSTVTAAKEANKLLESEINIFDPIASKVLTIAMFGTPAMMRRYTACVDLASGDNADIEAAMAEYLKLPIEAAYTKALARKNAKNPQPDEPKVSPKEAAEKSVGAATAKLTKGAKPTDKKAIAIAMLAEAVKLAKASKAEIPEELKADLRTLIA